MIWRRAHSKVLGGEQEDAEVLMRKKLAVVLAATLMLALSSGPAAFAANPPGTGPPTQSCEDQPSSPPGFGTSGFANGEAHYNPGSQYDTACFQVSNKGGSG
jgi:hypothetical protein